MLVFQRRVKEFLRRLIEPTNQSLGTNYGRQLMTGTSKP